MSDMSNQTLNKHTAHSVSILRLTNPPPDDQTVTEVQAVCTCGWRENIPDLTVASAVGAGVTHMNLHLPRPSNAPLAPASPQGRENRGAQGSLTKIRKEAKS